MDNGKGKIYNEIMSSFSALTDPALAIVFETSPLGLGHLRVTYALYHGLPKNAPSILLGTKAPASSTLYRFASVHKSTRTVLEMLQLPPLDKPVAAIGRKILRHQTKYVYDHLKSILNERFTVQQTVLLVATHAIHAHSMGAIKEAMAKELGITIKLVVQVTDDSPQAIWYVTDADMIFAPSNYTKKHLQEYAKRANLPEVPITVNAYPISPLLTEDLPESMLLQKRQQFSPSSYTDIHVSLPVSGAAVGTSFLIDFARALHYQSDRYVFHTVVRQAEFTQAYIEKMNEQSYVKVSLSTHERTTIENYEAVFKQNVIALEVTKPSEQTFKVLATPKHRGGSIILFTNPIGGQEYDNVRFLYTHNLIPTKEENLHLLQLSSKDEHCEASLKDKASQWRGVLIPENAEEAAVFVHWCLREGIFAKMMQYKQPDNKELQPNGVEQFWNTVTDLISISTSKG